MVMRGATPAVTAHQQWTALAQRHERAETLGPHHLLLDPPDLPGGILLAVCAA